MCWYCRWGWPKPISDIYEEAVQLLDGDYELLQTEAHVVWGDCNFDVAESFIDDVNDPVVRRSLELLAAIDQQFIVPDHWHYDTDAHPPPDDWELVKH